MTATSESKGEIRAKIIIMTEFAQCKKEDDDDKAAYPFFIFLNDVICNK